MQKNSTDHIAQLSYNAVKTHWKLFLLIPLGVFGAAIALGFLLGLASHDSLKDLIVYLQFIWLALALFFMVYTTAVGKWCETLYAGKTDLDLKGSFSYGLSRLGGTLGTTLLTSLKVFLWTLLLIVPGFYKLLVYSQSIHISQFEKMSGGNANRLSKTLIKEAGPLRTIGNYMVLTILFYLSFIVLYLLAISVYLPIYFNVSAQAMNANPSIFIGASILIGVLFFIWYIFVLSFSMCFGHFQYLVFRDENKTIFQKAIKDLKSING